jgi:hypothetical protein
MPIPILGKEIGSSADSKRRSRRRGRRKANAPAQHGIKPPTPGAQPEHASPRLPQLMRGDEPAGGAAGLALGHGLLDLVDLELAEALDLEEAAARAHGHQLSIRVVSLRVMEKGGGARRWCAAWRI